MILTWINRRSDPILELQLSHEGEILESLRFNPINESVRIRYEGYYQFFFLDNGKSWPDQVVFNNAYGIESGHINLQHYPSLSGVVKLDDQECVFTHSRNDNTIQIRRADAPEIALTALLPLEENFRAGYPIPGKQIEMDATILLLLCWNLLKSPVLVEVQSASQNYWRH